MPADTCINDNLFVLVYGFVIMVLYIIVIISLSIYFDGYTGYRKDLKLTKDAKYYKDTFLYKFIRYIRGDGKGDVNNIKILDVLGKKKIPKEYDPYRIHEVHKTLSINYTLMITFLSLIVLHFIFYLVVKYIIKSDICGIDVSLYGQIYFVAFIPIIITLIATIEFYDKKFKDLLNKLVDTNRNISNINRNIITNITTNKAFLSALTRNDALSILTILNQQKDQENLRKLLITQSIYSSIINSMDASSPNIQSINNIFDDSNNTLTTDIVPYLKIGLTIDSSLKDYINNNNLDTVFRRIYPNEQTRQASIYQFQNSLEVSLAAITKTINTLTNTFQKDADKYMKGFLIFSIIMFIIVMIIIGSLLKLMISAETLQIIFNKISFIFTKLSKLIVLIIPIIILVFLTK